LRSFGFASFSSSSAFAFLPTCVSSDFSESLQLGQNHIPQFSPPPFGDLFHIISFVFPLVGDAPRDVVCARVLVAFQLRFFWRSSELFDSVFLEPLDDFAGFSGLCSAPFVNFASLSFPIVTTPIVFVGIGIRVSFFWRRLWFALPGCCRVLFIFPSLRPIQACSCSPSAPEDPALFDVFFFLHAVRFSFLLAFVLRSKRILDRRFLIFPSALPHFYFFCFPSRPGRFVFFLSCVFILFCNLPQGCIAVFFLPSPPFQRLVCSAPY